MIAATLGGIGLFLLGMVLLTDGLKTAAGDSLRRVLSRFAGGPFSSFLSGAFFTALVQSSSATTLATIGFVSAGLLTFPQAVGVIFGANVGTTSTSWIVSTLGLKLNVSTFGLPLVGIGAIGRMFTKGRAASIGLALAGFGLIFVGIDILQQGMKGIAAQLDPASIPSGGFFGRLALVGFGMVMTVVMQSSSAAVATTLAALYAGALRIEQAAALVVGQNIGTTVTAAIAAIGATVPAKRTAVAHIVFNAATGVLAIVLLPLLVRMVHVLVGSDDPAVELAAFHTAFNVLGILVFLPMTNQFAAWIVRIVPERGPALTVFLDSSAQNVGSVAVEAANRSTRACAEEVFAATADALRGETDEAHSRLDRPDVALDEVRRFLARVRTAAEDSEHRRHLATLHAAEHLERMIVAARETQHARALGDDPMVIGGASLLGKSLDASLDWLRGRIPTSPAMTVEHQARSFAEQRRAHRAELLRRTAMGEVDPELATKILEAVRWIDRLGYHAWRVMHHLDDRSPSPERAEDAFDGEEVEAER
jgi:phosphate:Na+ symporter